LISLYYLLKKLHFTGQRTVLTGLSDVGNGHAHACCVSQSTVIICFKREWRFWCHFVPNLWEYTSANNYFTVKRSDEVIAEIKWCSFLPHSVYLTASCVGCRQTVDHGLIDWWMDIDNLPWPKIIT